MSGLASSSAVHLDALLQEVSELVKVDNLLIVTRYRTLSSFGSLQSNTNLRLMFLAFDTSFFLNSLGIALLIYD
jgi:hypothetical protein